MNKHITRLLQPGESQTLTFSVSFYELASFNQSANRWETAAGKYSVGFGASVEDIRASASFKVSGKWSLGVSDAFADVSSSRIP